MKVTDIETYLVRLPTRRPHRIWLGLVTQCFVLVKVQTDSGVVGLGEAPVLWTWGGSYGTYFGESPRTVTWVIRDFLEPAVRGEDPLNISRIHRRMERAVVGYPYAKASIDIALYDIAGKHLGVPVHSLMGGRYRSKIPLANSIGLMDMEDAAKEAREVVREGVRTLKIKVSAPGRDPQLDVEQVRAVREAVGDKIDITVDANQGWSTQVAIKTIRKMERYGIRFAEQPTEGLRNMARVKAAVDTPIMADESAWTEYDVLEILERKAADMVSLYWTKPGGLYRAMKVASVAQAAGLPCNVNGSVEMGVGNSANLHLASSAEPVTEACVIPCTTVLGREQTRIANVYYLDDIVKEPFRYEEGCLIVPKGPGLGVELDEKKMVKYKGAWPSR